eukprot:5904920-Pleurochrysis_carterae.AAC.2
MAIRPCTWKQLKGTARSGQSKGRRLFGKVRGAGRSPAYSETAKKTVRLVRSVRVVDEGDGYARADFLLKGALYKMVRFTSLTQSSQPSSGGDGQMLWSSNARLRCGCCLVQVKVPHMLPSVMQAAAT